MRRVTGLILAGLGAFLIASAVLMRTYLPGQVVKFPLHEYLVTQLVGHNVSYFSAAKVKPITGATMVVTSTTKSDDKAGNSDTAVWNTFTYLYDTTNHQRFSFSIRRLAFDRRTAELVQCCGASIDGNTHIRQSGLAGFLWPFGTGKHSYQVFDPGMNRTATARYAGTTTVGGISVYKYVEKVKNLKIGTQKIPASLVGLPGNKEVTLPESYTATNTFYVDPVTGAQLNEIQDTHLALTDPSTGAERLLLLERLADQHAAEHAGGREDRPGRPAQDQPADLRAAAGGAAGRPGGPDRRDPPGPAPAPRGARLHRQARVRAGPGPRRLARCWCSAGRRRSTSSRFQVTTSRTAGRASTGRVQPGRYLGTASVSTTPSADRAQRSAAATETGYRLVPNRFFGGRPCRRW